MPMTFSFSIESKSFQGEKSIQITLIGHLLGIGVASILAIEVAPVPEECPIKVIWMLFPPLNCCWGLRNLFLAGIDHSIKYQQALILPGRVRHHTTNW
jgi:hypothetical protein